LLYELQLDPGRHVLSSDPVSGVTVYGFSANEGFGTAATGHLATVDCGLFLDGFESGSTSAWCSVFP
jgi:hypothetical protein